MVQSSKMPRIIGVSATVPHFDTGLPSEDWLTRVDFQVADKCEIDIVGHCMEGAP